MPGGLHLGVLLGHLQRQHAAVVTGLDIRSLDAADVKAAAVRAVGALAADELAALVLVLVLGMALGVDGQGVALQIQMDVLLLEAGQVGFQLKVVALVGNIGLELRQRTAGEEVVVSGLKLL
jgi:hypothetical protein